MDGTTADHVQVRAGIESFMPACILDQVPAYAHLPIRSGRTHMKMLLRPGKSRGNSLHVSHISSVARLVASGFVVVLDATTIAMRNHEGSSGQVSTSEGHPGHA